MRKSHQITKVVGLLLATTFFVSCSKKEEANLVFKFKFDKNQERLNNFGLPTGPLPADHRAQSPDFNEMAAHYIELSPSAFTPLTEGAVIYNSPKNGNNAFLFDQLAKAKDGEAFFSIPLKDVPAGTYTYVRVSLAYQNFDISYRINPSTEIPIPAPVDLKGTLASFIGTKTYVDKFLIKTKEHTVNAEKAQGYWAFETSYMGWNQIIEGQVPEGAITVPNPIHDSSPMPPNSCVVTGPFNQPLVITGNETNDIVITISVSINNSFEWKETGDNDYYEPLEGDIPVDMGVRGIIPIIE